MQKTYRKLILIITLLLTATGLEAADWQALERGPVLAELARIERLRYPEADVVDVAWHKWVRYQADGRYEEYFESYFKVLTDKGVKAKRQLVSSFDLAYNSTAFTVAEVIAADGTVRPVDIEANTKVVIDSSQLASNIYDPDNRELVLSLPGLKPGDTVHFVMHDVFTKARVPGSFSDYVNFEDENPILAARYTVDAPAEKPLESIALKDQLGAGLKAERRQAAGRLIYTWEARDVPRYYAEPNMPPAHTQSMRLLVSTNRDWPELSRWYHALCEPAIASVTPAMRAKVVELTAGLNDREQRLRAIFRFVSQEIRYLGLTVEKDAPGYEPHAVNLTFERRAGVCRDKAALLVALLRLNGFDAAPVLIMNGPRKDEEVPQPFFNHAIVAVREADQTYRLMDPTDENTRELFPAYLANQSYLVADALGQTLQTSPVEDYSAHLVKLRTRASLDAELKLTATTRIDFGGINDNVYRSFFARQTAPEIRAYFERLLRQTWPGARLERLEVRPADVMDTETPLTAELSFTVGDFGLTGGGLVLLPLKGLGGAFGLVNFILDGLGLDERRFSYVSENPCGVEEELEIDCGAAVGKLASLPDLARIDDEGLLARTAASFRDGKLSLRREFALKLPEYDPRQYRALKTDLIRCDNDKRSLAVFAAAAVGEAWVLKDDNLVTVVDEHAWVERRRVKLKVLNYAGKKRLSDLRLEYNPAFEQVEVEYARVTGPDGRVERISRREINCMDAAWVGGAPRYPGAKTLIVSLPAVSENSLIELSIKRRKFDRPFVSLGLDALRTELATGELDAGFGLSPVMATRDRTGSKTLTIDLPERLAERYKPRLSQPGCRVATSRSAGRVRYSFTAENLAALKREPLSAPAATWQPQVSLGPGRSADWAAAVRRQVATVAAPGPLTRLKARELAAGETEPLEQLGLVRDFVARNIRLVNVGLDELPLASLSAADATLKAGYASQPDRTLMLGGLLAALGFEPEYVLASGLPLLPGLKSLLDENAPACFTSLLVRVRLGDTCYYLGDSDQYAPLGVSAHSGMAGLELNGGRLIKIEGRPELADRLDSRISIRLLPDDAAEITVERVYRGAYQASFVRALKESTAEERRRRHLEELAGIRRAARPLGQPETRVAAQAATSRFSLSCPAYAVRQGGLVYLDLYGLITRLSGVAAENRQAPLLSAAPLRRRIEIELELPAGRLVSAPPALELELPGGRMAITSSWDAARRRLAVTEIIETEAALSGPEAYAGLLRAQARLESPALRTVVFEPARSQ